MGNKQIAGDSRCLPPSLPPAAVSDLEMDESDSSSGNREDKAAIKGHLHAEG